MCIRMAWACLKWWTMQVVLYSWLPSPLGSWMPNTHLVRQCKKAVGLNWPLPAGWIEMKAQSHPAEKQDSELSLTARVMSFQHPGFSTERHWPGCGFHRTCPEGEAPRHLVLPIHQEPWGHSKLGGTCSFLFWLCFDAEFQALGTKWHHVRTRSKPFLPAGRCHSADVRRMKSSTGELRRKLSSLVTTGQSVPRVHTQQVQMKSRVTFRFKAPVICRWCLKDVWHT